VTRRTLVAWLTAAAWVASPTPALADGMWDFFSWMEEFSGPGPFSGMEVSFEVACYELVTHHTILAANPPDNDKDADLRAYQKAYQNMFMPGVLLPPATGAARTDAIPLFTDADRRAFFNTSARQIQQAILEGMPPRGRNPPKKTRGHDHRHRNCWASEDAFAQAAIQARSQAETDIFSFLDPKAVIKPSRVTIRERGPKTGVVLGVGYYRSRSRDRVGVLAVPDPTPGAPAVLAPSPNWPFMTIWIFEGLLHHKLTNAVDVGGGVGLSLFTANDDTDPKFHIVPVSVVMKPAAFVYDNKYASAFGLRLGARWYPTHLDGADFGLERGVYARPGELLWSASLYMDIASLIAAKAK